MEKENVNRKVLWIETVVNSSQTYALRTCAFPLKPFKTPGVASRHPRNLKHYLSGQQLEVDAEYELNGASALEISPVRILVSGRDPTKGS